MLCLIAFVGCKWMKSAKRNGISVMKILALEFSSPQRSVAVVQAVPPASSPSGEVLQFERTGKKSRDIVETGPRGAAPIGMINEALREAQIEREQIDCLAIGLGPGSYNGIRQAIALAQGWQLAAGRRGVKLLGISTAECLASQAHQQGLTGVVNVIIDAQRGEFYLASYDISAQGYREIDALHLATKEEVSRSQVIGTQFIGPGITETFPRGVLVFPLATTLGCLALNRNNFVSGEKIEPIYLREAAFVKAPPARVLQ